LPHAEIEALRDAEKKGSDPKGATMFVTLEPCCTHGRTPPCTEAIIAAGIRKVVIGATDPNPAHSGNGYRVLRRAGMKVIILKEHHPELAADCVRVNEAFNHWIVHRTPFVTVKAAMTMDGKIATARGESKWITGEKARGYGMQLRRGTDAILVGINTVLADDPALTPRTDANQKSKIKNPKRRIILDPQARTPLNAKLVSDAFASFTTVVVARSAPKNRVAALAKRVCVIVAPAKKSRSLKSQSQMNLDLRWLMKTLGAENVMNLLVEGGGETNASFLLGGFAHRVAFFYAPKILGGRAARKGVGGEGTRRASDTLHLREVEWRWLGPDLLLTARVGKSQD
jgi:diaminohydroxyphosphoribosylaminopyrimidine deaminase/5-amino-6-(5-phosphoribosylamino)uracil reductase